MDKGTLNLLVRESWVFVLIENVVAPFFATNCWIIATARAHECLIVDPGIGSTPPLVELIRTAVNRHNLKPVAALVTHGHLDHTFSVLPLANHYDIPALIHSSDRILLTDPWRALTPGGESAQIMANFGVSEFSEPDQVTEVTEGQVLSIAGISVTVIHSPGHTKGSVMFRLDDSHLIAGDVLFQGGIGRTDLPTGSANAMVSTLRHKVLTQADDLIVLPGHGAQTTIGRERKSNPFLRENFLTGKRP